MLSVLCPVKGGREDSRERGVILNQTSRNKGCCDLKGPWDHFCVSSVSASSRAAKKKTEESAERLVQKEETRGVTET